MASAVARTPTLDREFSSLYARHFGFVWRVVRRSGIAPADVDDVVQDVFVVVHRRLPDFEHRSTVETWLVGIVRRVAWRHRRGRARARRKHDGLRAVAATPDEFSAQRGAALDRLDRFVSGLPRGQREVFVLSELEGMRGPEIARATGTNLNTVYARIRTTRGRFRHWCEGEGHAPAEARRRGQAAANPPGGADRRIFGLVVARLGSDSAAVGMLASSWAVNVKIFAVVLGVGLVGAVGARVAIGPRRPATPPPGVSAKAFESPPPVPTEDPSPVVHAERPRAPPAVSTSAPPTTPRPVLARPSTAPRPTPAKPTTMSAEALAQERRLIAAARTLMDTDPRRALDRLTEHEHRFATGMLAPERLRLSIRAWCRLDRPERARRLAATTDDTTAILARECPDTDAGPTGDSPSTGP